HIDECSSGPKTCHRQPKTSDHEKPGPRRSALAQGKAKARSTDRFDRHSRLASSRQLAWQENDGRSAGGDGRMPSGSGDCGPAQPEDDFATQLIKKSRTPALLLLNKIDRLRGEPQKLLPLMEHYGKSGIFREVIPISARKKEGLDVLLGRVAAALPEGPRYFSEDEVPAQPVRLMVGELIREQLLLHTAEEVPHQTTVVVDEFDEGPRLVRIAATIYCEREGQKRILIGHQGQMLKKIGTA